MKIQIHPNSLAFIVKSPCMWHGFIKHMPPQLVAPYVKPIASRTGEGWREKIHSNRQTCGPRS